MTPLQLRAYEVVRDEIVVTGIAPTLRMLADRLGCGLQSAHKAVTALVDQGKLRRVPAATRGLELAEQPNLRLARTEDLRSELARRGVSMEALSVREPLHFGGPARTCAADSCQAEVRRGMLMCRTHWFALPSDLQDGIKRAFAARDGARYQELVTRARDHADGCSDGTGFRRRA